MKRGMSTSPDESTQDPQDDGRRGAAMPGSQSHRPIGAAPALTTADGKPDAKDEAKDDARDVAKAAAKGAATGGAAGAAKGALLAAAKSKTGKKGIKIAVAGVLVVILLAATALMGGGAGGSSGSSQAANSAEHGAQSYEVAVQAFEGDETLDKIRVAASRSDARWEILAAIHLNISDRSDHKGTGPMGIDKDKLPEGHGLSDEDLASLEESAYYLGGMIAPALEEAAPQLSSYELDQGYQDSDGNAEPAAEEDEPAEGEPETEEESFRIGTALPATTSEDEAKEDEAKEDSDSAEPEDEDSKTVSRTPVETEEGQILRDEIKAAYVTAIGTLPLKPNPDMAEDVFNTAQNWAVGKVPSPQTQCGPSDGGDVELGGQTEVDLNDSQLKYAQAIINRAASRGMEKNAAVVALATAMQESTLRMWWNQKVPGSEALTDDKDAMGSDGYSVGLFQQQVNGTAYSWGTVEDAMDPKRSTDMFLDRLETIPGWQSLAISVAAQRVQVSAHPDAYAKWEAMSRQLVNDLKPTEGEWKDSHDGGTDTKKANPASSMTKAFGTAEITTASFTVSTEKIAEEDLPKNVGEDKDLVLPPHLKINTSITADAQATEAAVGTRFGDYISAWGDVRDSSDDHGQKRAIDFMIRDYASAAGIKGGDEISAFLIANDKALGIEYLIWRDKIWLGAATGWKPYSTGGYGGMYTGNWNDTTLHNDHVHVTVYGSKGTGGDFKYTAPDGESSPCGGDHGAGTPGVGSGNGDDYPFKAPVGACAWCSAVDEGGSADPWGLYKRECVSFVAWRMNQQMGWKEGQSYPFTMAGMGMAGRGNAAEWSAGLAAKGYVTDMNPAPGAVAWWAANVSMGVINTGSAGHVAVVKEVLTDGNIVIEQYNGPGTAHKYSTQTIHKSKVSGFIHVADVVATPEKPKDDEKPAPEKPKKKPVKGPSTD